MNGLSNRRYVISALAVVVLASCAAPKPSGTITTDPADDRSTPAEPAIEASKPVAPIEPVEPVAPAAAVAPVTPVAPAPVEPVAPAKPQPSTRADGESCRLVWKLPVGRRLRYSCRVVSKGSGNMSMEADITLNVEITAAEEGLALVDASLGEASMKMDGRDPPNRLMLEQAFKVNCILDAQKGFDPLGVIAPQQRNVFDTFFPLPYKEVHTGEEWSLKVEMLSLGLDAAGDESSIVVLKSISGKPEARTASMALRSATSASSKPGKAGSPMRPKMLVSGSAEFDLSAGYFNSNAINASVVLPLTEILSVPTPGAGGIEMKVTLEVKLIDVGMLDAEKLAQASTVFAIRKAISEAAKLLMQGKDAEALALLEGPLEAGIAGERAHLVAAQIHAKAGNWQEAKSAIEKEYELSPDNPQVIQAAGFIYSRAGDRKKSKEMQNRLRDLMTGGPKPPVGKPAQERD